MRKVSHLNNKWFYANDYKEEYLENSFDFSRFESVDLPHTNKMLPYNYFNEKEYQFVSTYFKTLTFGEEVKGKRVFVDFEGVMMACEVYMNGVYVGSHKGGYTNFSIDITETLKIGEKNLLKVVVDSTERGDIPPHGYVVDYLTYGGIYREVSLRIVEPVYINNIYARAYDCLKPEKRLQLDIEINNFYEERKDIDILVEFGDDTFDNVLRMTLPINSGENLKKIEIGELSSIELWDIDNPKLYEIKVKLINELGIIDEYKDTFGFREAEFKGDGFYLNGRRLKLIGLNRHQAYPYVGYAMPERVQRKDADILKYELGLNIVRTSHYPQSVHFLKRCDEIGLLVFEEIPGWQHIGDEAWQEIAIKNVEEMVKRDYNRPSIILWGVRINESGDSHEFYTKTNKMAKSLDPVRQTGGVRYLTGSDFIEDVYTMNDFIHNGGEKVLRTQSEVTGQPKKVPYLVTEYNGHMYPTKTFDQECKRVEHAYRHLRVINEAFGLDEVSGAIGWCAFDYNTHSTFGSSDKICYHGVSDMFRNPKYAAYSYGSQKEAEKGIILEPISLGAKGERDGGAILPFSVLTNCDYIKVFKDEIYIDTYYPNKEKFPNLPHPPIEVTHILEMDSNLKLKDEDKDELRKFALNKMENANLTNFTEEDYKYIEDFSNRVGAPVFKIMSIIYRIAGGWGDKENSLCIKGFINHKEVASKDIGELRWMDKLCVIPDDFELSLNKSSYDATRVVVKLLDNMGEVMFFNNDLVEVEIDGPISILGPSKFGISGGSTAFWVRTHEKAGTCKIKVKSMYFEKEVVIEEK